MDEITLETHDGLVILIAWMAEQAEYDKNDLAYAVEKPWKFDAQFREAMRQRDDSE